MLVVSSVKLGICCFAFCSFVDRSVTVSLECDMYFQRLFGIRCRITRGHLVSVRGGQGAEFATLQCGRLLAVLC